MTRFATLLLALLLMPSMAAAQKDLGIHTSTAPSAKGGPANDNLAAAVAITADGESLSTTVGATAEASEAEASCLSNDSNQSVWWSITPSADATVTLDTDGSIQAPPGTQFTDTGLSVYTGSGHPLTEIACNDDDPNNTAGGDFTSKITDLALTGGTTYYVRVSSWSGGGRENGEARLTVTGLVDAGGPPANDNLADAVAIGADGEYLSSTTDATLETDEASASCTSNDSNQSVWWSFVPTFDGPIALDTNGSLDDNPPDPTDTIMSVYTGSGHPLTEVACNDDDPANSSPDFTSRIEMDVVAGTTYFVRVSSFGVTRANGEARLTVTGISPPAPSNDNLADAAAISTNGEYLSSTTNATLETNEAGASCTSFDSNQSVWWSFTASVSGPIALDTNGSLDDNPPDPTDTIMSVYTGSGHPLTEVACNDDDPTNSSPDFTSRIEMDVVAGTTYFVRVSSFGVTRANGEARLTMTGSAFVANEDAPRFATDALSNARPNPTAGRTEMVLTLDRAQDAKVAVYDMLGRQVMELLDGAVATETVIAIDTQPLRAGTYIVRAQGETFVSTRQIIVTR